MVRPFLLSAVLTLGASGAARADAPYNLNCDVDGPWGVQRRTLRVENSWLNTLALSDAHPLMYLIDHGRHDLTVESFGADKVQAVIDGTLPGWPHDVVGATFDLDRNSGGVTVSYVGPLHPMPTGKGWRYVIATETGHCVRAELAF